MLIPDGQNDLTDALPVEVDLRSWLIIRTATRQKSLTAMVNQTSPPPMVYELQRNEARAPTRLRVPSRNSAELQRSNGGLGEASRQSRAHTCSPPPPRHTGRTLPPQLDPSRRVIAGVVFASDVAIHARFRQSGSN
jgi:hypothetical protein